MLKVKFCSKEPSYIWTTQALVGPKLDLAHNILITIENKKITSLKQINKKDLPMTIATNPNLYCLEDDITLLPGLIDAHVHLALDGEDFRQALDLWKDEKKLLHRIDSDLKNLLNQGIIAVRDGGDKELINLKVKKLIKDKVLTGPIVIATGQALRNEKSYGSFLGTGVSSSSEFTNFKSFINLLKKQGINQLKVLVSGIVSFKEYGKVGPLQFNQKELNLIVDYAHTQGLRVMAHASSETGVNMAIEAKVDSLEHGYFISEKSLQEMTKTNIAWIPTVIPVAVQVTNPHLDKWSLLERDTITTVYKDHLKKIKLAESFGVKIGLGTDSGASGVRHGISLLEEMLYYQEAGLSNQVILKAATITNANILELNNSLGSIEIEKEPQLIGVQGNPLRDLTALKKVKWLFQTE